MKLSSHLRMALVLVHHLLLCLQQSSAFAVFARQLVGRQTNSPLTPYQANADHLYQAWQQQYQAFPKHPSLNSAAALSEVLGQPSRLTELRQINSQVRRLPSHSYPTESDVHPDEGDRQGKLYVGTPLNPGDKLFREVGPVEIERERRKTSLMQEPKSSKGSPSTDQTVDVQPVSYLFRTLSTGDKNSRENRGYSINVLPASKPEERVPNVYEVFHSALPSVSDADMPPWDSDSDQDGESIFSRFDNDDADCPTIETKTCRDDTECRCSGFYGCFSGRCKLLSEADYSDPDGIQDIGDWGDPVVFQLSRKRRASSQPKKRREILSWSEGGLTSSYRDTSVKRQV